MISFEQVMIPLVLIGILLLLVFLVVLLKLYLERSNIGLQRQRIELEMFRQSIESSLYMKNKELAANRERWEDANHMLYEASRRPIVEAGSHAFENNFLSSLSIDRDEIAVDQRSAFLLAPIHPIFKKQNELIKSAFSSLGMTCETADEEFVSGPILSVIVRRILSASVVVALIDGRNPNVYYEIGLAHAFGKSVLMVANGVEDVPFDIQSQRLVIVDWENQQEAFKKIQRAAIDIKIWAERYTS